MYSAKIETKINAMFENLRNKVADIVAVSSSSSEAVENVTRVIGSELAIRSKSLKSDMLFDLTDDLMETEFFADISRRNKFYERDIRQEILSKYEFVPSTSVDYREASKVIQALKVGGTTFVVGGAVEVGVVLTAGLSLSSLVPIPISILIIASIGAALVDCYAIEPARSKKVLTQALDDYLVQAKKQFLGWFDEVEILFNKRAEEIKLTM